MTSHKTNIGPAAAVSLVLLAAGTFLLGALLHAGLELPLAVVTLSEPRIVPATIVEGLCGLALLVGANGVLARRPWGWRAARAACILAILGVLLGMVSLAVGAGPRTQSNDLLHVVMLVLLLAGLGAISSARAPAASGAPPA